MRPSHWPAVSIASRAASVIASYPSPTSERSIRRRCPFQPQLVDNRLDALVGISDRAGIDAEYSLRAESSDKAGHRRARAHGNDDAIELARLLADLLRSGDVTSR